MADIARLRGLSMEFGASALTWDTARLRGLSVEFGAPDLNDNRAEVMGFSLQYEAANLEDNRSELLGFECEWEPAPPTLGPRTPEFQASLITGEQLVGSDVDGQTRIAMQWTDPTKTMVVAGEYLGTATGAAQMLNTGYRDICSSGLAAETGKAWEITGFTAGGGSTTPSLAVAVGDSKVTVLSAANFAVGDHVQIAEGTIKVYNQIKAIDGSVLRFYFAIQAAFSTAATVKEVDVVSKAETTAWTLDRTNGVLTLVSGQWTSGKDVVLRYACNLSGVGLYDVWRIPGNMPLPDDASYAEVAAYAGAVHVDGSISGTSKNETLVDTQNAKTWTYYLFARSADGWLSRAQGVMVETIPGVPQNVAAAGLNMSTIRVTWNAVGGDNVDGYHVYRCVGATFVPANAYKLNVAAITDLYFDDGPTNPNRRPSGEVPMPAPNTTYSYKVVSADTLTDWDTGTEVTTAETSENTVADKSDEYTPPNP